jgi:hypothetical protein
LNEVSLYAPYTARRRAIFAGNLIQLAYDQPVGTDCCTIGLSADASRQQFEENQHGPSEAQGCEQDGAKVISEEVFEEVSEEGSKEVCEEDPKKECCEAKANNNEEKSVDIQEDRDGEQSIEKQADNESQNVQNGA